MLAIAVSFGFARYGYGLFLPEIRDEFALSEGAVGMIGSATYGGYLVGLAVAVAFAERLGPRVMVAMSGVSATVGMGVVSRTAGIGTLTFGLVLAGTSAAWAWAPYSDAVGLLVEPDRRDRALASSQPVRPWGTAVVGPLALLSAGTGWRAAWLSMAVASALVTLYNIWLLPAARRTPHHEKLGPTPTSTWRQRRTGLPLYATALSYGLIGAFYWYFATEAVTDASARPETARALFWTVIGIAGMAGVGAGAILARLGPRHTSRLLFGLISLAMALLGLAPSSIAAATVSALLFGPSFMAVSSLLAVWSYRVFSDRPSAGLSEILLCLGVGTVIGPMALGVLAERTDLRVSFLAAAGLSLMTVGVRAPR